MALLLNTGFIGRLYFITLSSILLYLIYLSIVQKKYAQVKKWQIFVLYVIAILSVFIRAFSVSNYMNLVGCEIIPSIKKCFSTHFFSFLIGRLSTVCYIFLNKTVLPILTHSDAWIFSAIALTINLSFLFYLIALFGTIFVLHWLWHRFVFKQRKLYYTNTPLILISAVCTYALVLI